MIRSVLCKYLYFYIIVFYCEGIENVSSDVEGRIIGGQPVPIENASFAVLFFNDQSLCSGVIINSFSILTAAHCFNVNKNKDLMHIEVNCSYLYDINAENFDIDNFVVHEDFNKHITFEADIALIFLKGNMVLDQRKRRALLMNGNEWMNGKANVSVFGWGWTEYGGSVSKLGLMGTYLRYVSRRRCERLHNLRLSADMFCLYGDGERDTCRGDSGGGVTAFGIVVGLVSHGNGCAKKDKPSVYISVSYHRKWIEKTISDFLIGRCATKH